MRTLLAVLALGVALTGNALASTLAPIVIAGDCSGWAIPILDDGQRLLKPQVPCRRYT
jgi:hypothetical protein